VRIGVEPIGAIDGRWLTRRVRHDRPLLMVVQSYDHRALQFHDEHGAPSDASAT
jgi:hypothetical protein